MGIGDAVEVLVVVGALQDPVAVAVVADEVDQSVVVAVLVDVDAAVAVPDRDVLVPLSVAVWPSPPCATASAGPASGAP
ncbi:MAG: hypothetical protein AUG44_04795 [Actinobacteria bacterium 13_1_20CM_3_71_11]|nr:MAG: hypothetical protein AUG44_04795 [Actinobacteria bacterium 13_1_20CM_3_71_11]